MILIKIFFMLAVLYICMSIFNYIMIKHLKVEKYKLFSYNHINEKHKKIDWIIRIMFVITMFVVLFYRETSIDAYASIQNFIQPILLVIFMVTSEMTRAFMEWKYAENRKTYIFTISQLVFSLILLFIVFSTNFFNLL